MTTAKLNFSRDKIGWLLSAGAFTLLAIMSYYAVPANLRNSFFFQLAFVLLGCGIGLAYGLVKFRDH